MHQASLYTFRSSHLGRSNLLLPRNSPGGPKKDTSASRRALYSSLLKELIICRAMLFTILQLVHILIHLFEQEHNRHLRVIQCSIKFGRYKVASMHNRLYAFPRQKHCQSYLGVLSYLHLVGKSHCQLTHLLVCH